ncbi:MAG: hypothetical protein M3299_01605 [Thermoproteota archaeon]|nr:hypothetical protein [Thermoproteota archaeon]
MMTKILTAALLLATALVMTPTYAQFGATPSSETTTGTTGQPQEDSDALLTATLNGDTFKTGDTITVSGTVEERDIDSHVTIEVIDPSGQTVQSAYPTITADNTYTYSFTAGVPEEFHFGPEMKESGNYRMTLTYFKPGDDFGADDFMSEIEFVFQYTHIEGATAVQEEDDTSTTNSTSDTTVRRTVDARAMRNVVADGLEHVQQLNATMSQSQVDSAAYIELNQIQRAFENIQGNLTGVTPTVEAVG